MSGTPCAVHTDEGAAFVCIRCGSFGCPACAFSPLRERTILAEGAAPPRPIECDSTGPHSPSLDFVEPAPLRGTVCKTCAARGLAEPIPWERRKELGFWTALSQTTRAVCARPTRFFRTPFIADDMGSALYYGTAMYTLGQALYALTLGLAFLVGGIGLGISVEEPIFAGVGIGYGVCIFVSIAVQAPIYGLMGILVGGACSHGTLALLKSANASIDMSIRTVAYANGPQIFFAVPCIGYLAPFWVIWLETIGLREVHRISTGKALLATLGYRVLFLAIGVGAYALILGLAYFSVRQR